MLSFRHPVETRHSFETDLTIIEGDEAHFWSDYKLVIDYSYEHPWNDGGERIGGDVSVHRVEVLTPANEYKPCPDWIVDRLFDDYMYERLASHAEDR